jgi:serine/threonine-protein phosphatase 2B catalytic subunit
VPQPARPATDEQFWSVDRHGRRKPNAEFLRDHFLREGRLTEAQALALLRQATDMLATEPNVLKVKSPVTGMLSSHLLDWELNLLQVVGDIHGQYVSDCRILLINYQCLDSNFLV